MMTGSRHNGHITNRTASNSAYNGGGGYEVLDIEIDHVGCGNSQATTHCCSTGGKHLALYNYHEVPPFLRGNPYVVEGYRAMLPFSLCLKR